MKKIFALLLAVAMFFCFAACDLEAGYNNLVSDAQKEANKAVTRGTISGNTYTSEFTNITFSKPEEWRYCSDEELAETMSIEEDQLDENIFSDTITEIASVYDMMAIDENTGTNVVIGYENVSITNGGSMTAEAYLEAIETSFATDTTLTVEFAEKSATTLSGISYLRAICNVKSQGVEMQQVYYIRSIDDFVNFIIVTIPSGYSVDEIEAMFV